MEEWNIEKVIKFDRKMDSLNMLVMVDIWECVNENKCCFEFFSLKVLNGKFFW